jgi:hypothetical protein
MPGAKICVWKSMITASIIVEQADILNTNLQNFGICYSL